MSKMDAHQRAQYHLTILHTLGKRTFQIASASYDAELAMLWRIGAAATGPRDHRTRAWARWALWQPELRSSTGQAALP